MAEKGGKGDVNRWQQTQKERFKKGRILTPKNRGAQ